MFRLGQLGRKRSVELLTEQLEDGNWMRREAACRALGRLRDRRALEPLISRLGDDRLLVRQAACEALGHLRNQQAVGPFVERLGDEDWRVCRAACEALVALGLMTVARLIRALEDHNPYVRWLVCEALGRLEDGWAVEPLISRLGDDTPWIREATCDALGRLADQRAVKSLLLRLEDSNVEVRNAACKALTALSQLLQPHVDSLLCHACLARFQLQRKRIDLLITARFTILLQAMCLKRSRRVRSSVCF